MSKFVKIEDGMGTYWVNPDAIVTVTEDPEGRFGCIVYTANPQITFQFRMGVSEVLNLLS